MLGCVIERIRVQSGSGRSILISEIVRTVVVSIELYVFAHISEENIMSRMCRKSM